MVFKLLVTGLILAAVASIVSGIHHQGMGGLSLIEQQVLNHSWEQAQPLIRMLHAVPSHTGWMGEKVYQIASELFAPLFAAFGH